MCVLEGTMGRSAVDVGVCRGGNAAPLSPQGPTDSLGISIAGGVGSPLGDVPIFIAMMNPTGLAAQTQKLKVPSQQPTPDHLSSLESPSCSLLEKLKEKKYISAVRPSEMAHKSP